MNGLVNAIEGNIRMYTGQIEPYVTSAISDITKADPMGIRLACGFVSDLSYHLSEEEMSPLVSSFVTSLL